MYFEDRDNAWRDEFRKLRAKYQAEYRHEGLDSQSRPNPLVAQLHERLEAAGLVEQDMPNRTQLLDELDLSLDADEDRFRIFGAPQLNSSQFNTRYLIPGILTAGQPGGLFGAFKTLKTSLTADLLISLASGTPFLDHFPVAEPGPTLFLSGESGLAALQSIARRICAARGLSLDTLDNFMLSSDLPRLDNSTHVRALARIIRAKKLVCVAIDPAYLTVRQEDARNLFAMGARLRPLAEVCASTGCTVLVVHHCKLSKVGLGNPATLDDIAWSGFAEFSAQWLTLSRRQAFDPDTGRHELWLNVGGRAGHRSLWALDVDEGRAVDLDEAPTAARSDEVEAATWKTSLRRAPSARAQADERYVQVSEDRRVRRLTVMLERHRERVLNLLSQHPDGKNARHVRDALSLSGGSAARVLSSLVRDGLLIAVTPARLKRPEVIYRLTCCSNECADAIETSSSEATVPIPRRLPNVGTGQLLPIQGELSHCPNQHCP
jgi:DNA-binding transcriptional ArsR family regulator